MANRKQFLSKASPNPRLAELLAATKHLVVSESDLREQQISFAYGNAMGLENITKASVRSAAARLRLFSVQ